MAQWVALFNFNATITSRPADSGPRSICSVIILEANSLPDRRSSVNICKWHIHALRPSYAFRTGMDNNAVEDLRLTTLEYRRQVSIKYNHSLRIINIRHLHVNYASSTDNHWQEYSSSAREGGKHDVGNEYTKRHCELKVSLQMSRTLGTNPFYIQPIPCQVCSYSRALPVNH